MIEVTTNSENGVITMKAATKIETISVKMYPDSRLDVKNASLYLGLEEKTLAMKRSDGTGPSFIKRGRIFYFKDDLDAWINECTRAKSTAQLRALK